MKFVPWIAILTIFGLTACTQPSSDAGSRTASPSLAVMIQNNVNARTLTPGVSMEPASYTVSGIGPHGELFSEYVTNSVLTKTGLAVGTWTVVVEAANAEGFPIGRGQSAVEVGNNATNYVTVTVRPLPGDGDLNVSVSWPAELQNPSWGGTLTPAFGAPMDVTPGDLSFQQTIPAGYYTLALWVKDGDERVAGSVEVVRIVAGATTTGSYSFTNLKQGGGFEVSVDFDFQNPMRVVIEGPDHLSPNGTAEYLPTIEKHTGGYVFLWYVDGVPQGVDSTLHLGPFLQNGVYRIDLVAFAADGTTGGSATLDVTVAPQNSNAVWAKLQTPQAPSNGYSALAADPSGNLLVGGALLGTDAYNFGNGVEVSGGSTHGNAFLMKTTAEGTPLWALEQSAPTTNSVLNGVASDAQGNIYAIGYLVTYNGTVDFGNGVSITDTHNSGEKGFVLKVSPAGVPLWLREIPDQWTGSTFFGIAVVDDGVVVSGRVTGAGTRTFPNGTTLTTVAETSNGVLVKFDSDGEAVWAVGYAGEFSYQYTAVSADPVGSLHVIAYPHRVLTFDGEGALTADQDFPFDELVDVAAATDGVYLLGNLSGSPHVDFGNGITLDRDALSMSSAIVKLDAQGHPVWVRSNLQTAQPQIGESPLVWRRLAAGPSGIAASGTASDVGVYTFDFGNGYRVEPHIGSEALVVRYSATGALHDAETVTSLSDSEFGGVLLTSDSLFVLGTLGSGWSNQTGNYDFGNDVHADHGGGVLVRYDF